MNALDRAVYAAIRERDMHDANKNEPAADGWEELRADLREARAAMAELIEAAKRGKTVPAYSAHGDAILFAGADAAAFRAALAAVTPADGEGE